MDKHKFKSVVYHQKYQLSLKELILAKLKRKARALSDDYLKAVFILYMLDLDTIRPTFENLYAKNSRGRQPIDPISVFRAFLLMTILKFTSITKFAKELRQRPLLAIIAGFEPHQTPSIGLFYLLVDRLENGNFTSLCPHIVKPSSYRKNGVIRSLILEKQNNELIKKKILTQYDTITEHLAHQLLSSQQSPRPNDFQKRLEDIFFNSALLPSAKRGALGCLTNNSAIVSGDGSTLCSYASCYGKPTCDCRKQGIYRCEHDHIYFDPTADWGWDSYHKRFYFGHRFYQHCINFNGHDLPVHITIGQASESDFTLTLKSFDRMLKTFKENSSDISFYAACYDAGHDATGIYKYHLALNHEPVIALNSRSENPKSTGTAESINKEGVPLCAAGLPMKRHAHDRKRNRIYFHCPVKRVSHNGVWNAHVNECPFGVLCQPDTKLGPVVYVRSDQDSRLYPNITRGSDEYQRIMNLRTSCERSNSAKKDNYGLDQKPCRSATHYLFRLYLISIVEHGKSWVDDDFQKLLSYFDITI